MKKRVFLFIGLSFAMTMLSHGAELMVKVGSSPFVNGYQDGDIVAGFTDEHIQWVNAQNVISEWRRNNPSVGTPRAYGSIWQLEEEAVRELRVEKTGENQVTVTNLWNTRSHSETRPNLQAWLNERMKNPQHFIFTNLLGQETWYEGDYNPSQTNVNTVWTMLELNTGVLKSNNLLWPRGLQETKRLRFIRVDSLTEAQVATLTTETRNASGQVTKARSFRVDYTNLPGLTAQEKIDIADPTIDFDSRSKGIFTRTDIVQAR